MKNEQLFNNLRVKFNSKKLGLNYTLKEIAIETSVDVSSLSRFSNGLNLDVDAAIKLGNWVGMEISEIFDNKVIFSSEENTLDAIKNLIIHDVKISENKRVKLAVWFEETYKLMKSCQKNMNKFNQEKCG
ncbi:MAG: hypothetical protein WBP82_08710 [Leuconostoc mesenteroides]